jgi:hypothetical protein
VWELPADAWEQYFASGDGAVLLARLLGLPARQPPRDVSYPHYHRIWDVALAGRAYRLTRLVDLG